MRRVLILLSIYAAGNAFASTYQPNTSTFSCPDGEIVDTSKPINISVGERPGGIGECFWRDPVVSFSVSDDRNTVTGRTTWNLDGGWLADGCSDIKGEKMTSQGIVAKVFCKMQTE